MHKHMTFVSRGGEKLDHAVKEFGIDPTGLVCADFGASTGGFVDCWLQHGATKVYAVETGYGILEWKLRNDERVVVMERTNAMHVELPEQVDFISIDTSWTRLEKIIPSALKNLKPNGQIITLLKPHYEASQKDLRKGKLQEDSVDGVVEGVLEKVGELGVEIKKIVESPIVGGKGKNREFLLHLLPKKQE
jgi:23S rRNA (cytidine1920-2'-O)/16S rRNA (cytidine1409-2'-O)-methyltransferase